MIEEDKKFIKKKEKIKCSVCDTLKNKINKSSKKIFLLPFYFLYLFVKCLMYL